MTYYVPSALKEIATSSNVGYTHFPDHIHYKCINLLSDVADTATYKGNEIQDIELFFGINDSETRERRNKDGWSRSTGNVSSGDAGPLLIDIIIHIIFNDKAGERIDTNIYIKEPAEYISSNTYKELFRDEAISTMRSTSKIEL